MINCPTCGNLCMPILPDEDEVFCFHCQQYVIKQDDILIVHKVERVKCGAT